MQPSAQAQLAQPARFSFSSLSFSGGAVDLSAPGESADRPQIAIGPDDATAVWDRFNGADNIIQSASTGQPSILLQVERAGSGTGTVTSAPAGISCGADCAENYLSFTKVVLTAAPSPGSTFTGWSGAGCSGTGTCQVTLLDAATVSAGFAAIPKATINKVKVSGPARVKKGRTATYKVKISNSGNAQATGVRLKLSGRGVSFNMSVGKISAGTTRTVQVKLKPKKPGKVKVTFKVTSSNAGGKTVKKTITVRK